VPQGESREVSRFGDITDIESLASSRRREVIPYVIGPIVDARTGAERPYKMPKACPSCGEAVRTGTHRTAEGAKRFCKKCETEM